MRVSESLGLGHGDRAAAFEGLAYCLTTRQTNDTAC